MHPSFGVTKTYLADRAGAGRPGRRPPAARRGRARRDGSGGRSDAFRVVQTQGRRAIVEVVLHEGRKHIVRRLLAAGRAPGDPAGAHRDRPVRLGGQRAGTLRELTRADWPACSAL